MGKISNIQRERELIGLFMLSRDAINTAINEKFTAEECTNEHNKQILEIILEEARFNNDFIPSSHFIIDKLELKKEKDIKQLQLKLNRYKKMIEREVINDSQYVDISQRNILKLRDLYTKRKVIQVLKNGLDSIDLPARDFISQFQKGLNDVEINDGLIVEISIHSGFKELKDSMIYQLENGIEFGIQFGLRDFDKMTQDQIALETLTYVVGRPSNYKTGTALNLAQNAAEKFHIPTAFFSHEMSAPDVYRRLLARVTGIPMKKLKRPGELEESDWELLDKAIEKVESWPLYVIDAAKLNIGQIDSVLGYMKAKYGVQLVLEDYFQLIRTRKGNIPTEEFEFGQISEELRMMAKNHKIAMVALSQANRSCEARDDKRPTLKDIRNTGKAEQDAHNIFYVYRDEFYYGSKSEIPNHMEIGALKIREGELRKALFHFNGAKATIGNVDPLVVMDKPRDYIGGGGLAE
jgi:replicative DNA helicase